MSMKLNPVQIIAAELIVNRIENALRSFVSAADLEALRLASVILAECRIYANTMTHKSGFSAQEEAHAKQRLLRNLSPESFT